MRQQITLVADDAERFDRLREKVASRRSGSEPGNAELVRVLMDEYE